MSLSARREMLASIRNKYRQASWALKRRILDGFIASTGYDRKYAIQLLNSKETSACVVRKHAAQKYDEQTKQALLSVWYTANQICSKRLVPFIPDLVAAMERHGHLRLPSDVRTKLLNISPATVDRLLQPERNRTRQGLSLTKPGTLLKHQIEVRTFADWDNVIPGFFEADLVAHCGGNPNGAFLNTLVLVDISTGWLECMPLMRKSASDVIDGLKISQELMPFPLLGLDTDCGSEFINYDVLDFCEDNDITFTRARTHRKNDQAFVEEKNGSVVRRLVGYDRFEGRRAWEALARLYAVLRKYINFFQPSLKLTEKKRHGAKVTKRYDQAKTPFQRILCSAHVPDAQKQVLESEFASLDPVLLLHDLQSLQENLWTFAWSNTGQHEAFLSEVSADTMTLQPLSSGSEVAMLRHFHFDKPKDKRSGPRTYRTRKDPFEGVWDEIRLRIELMPELCAREIINWLSVKYPNRFSKAQIRTLQRRLNDWRLRQEGYQARLRVLMEAAPGKAKQRVATSD